MKPFDLARDVDLLVPERVGAEDAQRQAKTAREVVERLKSQPGLILADEVGMGKTFVALATAAAAHFTDPERRPVVVMVPPALAEKWPRDAELFRNRCLAPHLREEFRFPHKPIESGTSFLRTLDDADLSRRNAVVFVTHGALHRSLSDAWVKLAILRRALHGRHDAQGVRRAVGRFAGELLRMQWVDESVWTDLLGRDPSEWLRYLQRHQKELAEELGHDDPVPAHLWTALDSDVFVDELRAVYDCLCQMPKRDSKHRKAKLKDSRHELKEHIERVWDLLKGHMKLRLPLLIFDEAHHLKNSQTHLVKSLFQGGREDLGEINGAFQGVFEKMLMLTATPFQLGHHELLNVISLFEAVAWERQSVMDRGAFIQAKERLARGLDEAQSAALRLDQAWSRLRPEDLVVDGKALEGAEWWDAVFKGSAELTSGAIAAREQAEATDKAMRAAETELRPWILRHLRPRTVVAKSGRIERRRLLPGSGIADETATDRGLEVSGPALLPFLLSARIVALHPDKRAVFAEGLASSYEAFLHTHASRDAGSDSDDDVSEAVTADKRAAWYMERIKESLLLGKGGESGQAHPKMQTTVEKVIKLWGEGEKVVVFCHYIHTGRALRRAISQRMRDEIIALASRSLPGLTSRQVETRLEQFGTAFFDKDGSVKRRFDELASSIAREAAPSLGSKDIELAVDVMRRFCRTPSFLARYFSLKEDLKPEHVDAAFNDRFGSEDSLKSVFIRFLKFIESREQRERGEYLGALDKIQTGSHLGTKKGIEGEVDLSEEEAWMPNVRLVNGQTTREARRVLMLTFNTPFYPEVLIASSVLAEGVDLHLNCRHVIHHDLCWNPSTLEQRTGRVDRIGAKVEKCGIPIDIFMPYVEGTQDEKMYRVVTDRERWFKVVMGEEVKQDAATVERLARRIPLPEKLAQRLMFNLSVAT